MERTSHHLGLLILRLGFGGLMLPHGIAKIGKLFPGEGSIKFADPIGLGPVTSLILVVFAEVICSSLVIVGLKTRLAALPLVITMLVAGFITHLDDPFAKKEFAFLYAIGFLAIMIMGPGKYALDEAFFGKSRR